MRLSTGIALGALLSLLAACMTLTGPGVGTEGEEALRTLTLEADGPGAIAVDGLGVNCTSVCNVPVEPGSALDLRAVPTGNQPFAGWEGPCSGPGSCSVFVDGDMKVRAVFATYFMNVNVEGGGIVHVSPPGVDCSSKCIVKFDSPSEVKVTRKTENTVIRDWGGICDEAVNSICVVNVEGKTDVSVETDTIVEVPEGPPDQDPPPEDAPAQDPPPEDAPAQDPPPEDAPTDDPPPEDPPTEDPPPDDGDPPIFDPPFDDPVVEDPPIQPPDDGDPPIFDPPLDDPALDPPLAP